MKKIILSGLVALGLATGASASGYIYVNGIDCVKASDFVAGTGVKAKQLAKFTTMYKTRKECVTTRKKAGDYFIAGDKQNEDVMKLDRNLFRYIFLKNNGLCVTTEKQFNLSFDSKDGNNFFSKYAVATQMNVKKVVVKNNSLVKVTTKNNVDIVFAKDKESCEVYKNYVLGK